MGNQEDFGNGLSEEILNLLVGIGELKVCGRTSSFSFKGTNVPIREIGRTLGVAHVLDGRVRRSGDGLRIAFPGQRPCRPGGFPRGSGRLFREHPHGGENDASGTVRSPGRDHRSCRRGDFPGLLRKATAEPRAAVAELATVFNRAGSWSFSVTDLPRRPSVSAAFQRRRSLAVVIKAPGPRSTPNVIAVRLPSSAF